MSAPVRIGVIGLGSFAQNHLEAWRALQTEGVALASVCDLSPERVAAAQARFGVPGFTDVDAMLRDTTLDAVDIVTTAPFHRALVEKAARAGLAIICQKPLAETMTEAEAMVAQCRDAGISLTVHENFRFQPAMRAMARRLADNEIGVPFRASVDFRSRHNVYRAQPYLATDARFILLDLGVHLFDLCRVFMGEVVDVACWIRRVNADIRGEDVATAVLGHGGGRTSVVTCSYATHRAPDTFPQTLVTLEGPDGTLELLPAYRIRHTGPDGTRETEVRPAVWPWSTAPLTAIQDSVVTFQRDWLRCLRAGVAAETSGEANLHTLAIVNSAYQDAASRR